MPNIDGSLKGILKSLKQINAALGTVAGADISADLQAVITAEGVVNANVDLIVALVGTGGAGVSLADQATSLQAVLE